MAKKLVIVESPAKAKTIKKYLGEDFDVAASMGHVRDLPEKKLGVDTKTFTPEYEEMKGKAETIIKLKSAAAKADKVYLATDPDREGEAISWHLANLLGLNTEDKNRVTFNEITKKAVGEGINNPRPIDINLVDAQQARRVLDRLVGYKLSPFLWKKIKKGLSAGRVQSVACRLVVEREREIMNFKPEEYWNITAELIKKGNKKTFNASFHGSNGKKTVIKNERECSDILSVLKSSEFTVSEVRRSVKTRQPFAPFITSTMQQDASRRLNFTSKNTMRIAQTLYEGVELKDIGLTGLITYMRTDSTRISEEAVDAARAYITDNFGGEFCPKTAKKFKTKSNSQDAHEAIRPSDVFLTPDRIKESLTSEQYKLYRLIWERFVASQMKPAVYDTVSVDINADIYLFRATDQKVKFAGFTVLYEEANDNEAEKPNKLPELETGDRLELKDLKNEQKFTQPPARYNEASLIKTLEENGIGRPSTYAPIISTILDRGYVEKEKKNLKATELGMITTELMERCFNNIVDTGFTADMEKQLDSVETGKEDWKQLLTEFYDPFINSISKAETDLKGQKFRLKEEESDEECPNCGKKLVIRSGRYGKFLACPGYPACKFTKPIIHETNAVCPKCGGKVVEKKTKRSKVFYGCMSYPDCDFASWDVPTGEQCPECGGSLFKKNGKDGYIYCSKECGYKKEKGSRKTPEQSEVKDDAV